MELGRPDRENFRQDQQHPPPPRRVKPADMAAAHGQHQHQPPPPPQKCPRCDSSNTKFCYYNNYSLSQPRYFCKGCRRYWTHGGTLRNVPVGGGCRKSKRPKQSAAASSSSGSEIGRTQPLSTPSILGTQNLTVGMASGPSLIRALPPVMPSVGNSFFPGGGVLSTLGALHSLPPGIMSQAPAVNFAASGGVGGGGQYGANMALLQGLNLPTSLKPQPPLQFQTQNDLFSPQQSFNFPTRPLISSWTQGFISGAPSSGAAPFWSRSTADGSDNQAGSSFAPNRWSDKTPGFDIHPSE